VARCWSKTGICFHHSFQKKKPAGIAKKLWASQTAITAIMMSTVRKHRDRQKFLRAWRTSVQMFRWTLCATSADFSLPFCASGPRTSTSNWSWIYGRGSAAKANSWGLAEDTQRGWRRIETNRSTAPWILCSVGLYQLPVCEDIRQTGWPGCSGKMSQVPVIGISNCWSGSRVIALERWPRHRRLALI